MTSEEFIQLMYSDGGSYPLIKNYLFELVQAGKFVDANDILMKMEYDKVCNKGMICVIAYHTRHFLFRLN